MEEPSDHDDTPVPHAETPIAARTFYLRIFLLPSGRQEPIVRGEVHGLDGASQGARQKTSRLGAFNSLDGLTALLRRLLLNDNNPSDRENTP